MAYVTHLPVSQTPHHKDLRWKRRLEAIPDKEGKTRVIALFDYYSQCILKGVHDALGKILKTIPEDFTYSQDSFRHEAIKYFRVPKNLRPRCASVDLKSATDRLPMQLQHFIINELFQDNVRADAWKDLMIGFPFASKSITLTDSEIHYLCNTPEEDEEYSMLCNKVKDGTITPDEQLRFSVLDSQCER